MRFEERRAAAASQKNAWTKMASTYGCMRIAVDEARLSIHPRGLLRLFMTPLFLDLDHEIPLSAIVESRHVGDWHGHDKISIRYRHPDGGTRELLLYTKKGSELMRCLSVV